MNEAFRQSVKREQEIFKESAKKEGEIVRLKNEISRLTENQRLQDSATAAVMERAEKAEANQRLETALDIIRRSERRQCKCEFSSGGVLKKSCEYHKQREEVAERNALEQAQAMAVQAIQEKTSDEAFVSYVRHRIGELMKEGGE